MRWPEIEYCTPSGGPILSAGARPAPNWSEKSSENGSGNPQDSTLPGPTVGIPPVTKRCVPGSFQTTRLIDLIGNGSTEIPPMRMIENGCDESGKSTRSFSPMSKRGESSGMLMTTSPLCQSPKSAHSRAIFIPASAVHAGIAGSQATPRPPQIGHPC